MPNKIFSIHPKDKKIKDKVDKDLDSNDRSHGHSDNKPDTPTLIKDAVVIVCYKVGSDVFLLYNGCYYEAKQKKFYIEYYDDLTIKLIDSSDNSEIIGSTSLPKATVSDVEYIVISHVEGSTWKLIYFNGRYYWVKVA